MQIIMAAVTTAKYQYKQKHYEWEKSDKIDNIKLTNKTKITSHRKEKKRCYVIEK